MVSEEGDDGPASRALITTTTTTTSPSISGAAASSSSSLENVVCEDGWDPARNQDEAIKAQEHEIEREIAERNQLIGDKIPLDALLSEYQAEDHVYRSKIHDLKSIYETMRKSRPDGNCFFRAFGFSLFDSLLTNDHEIDRLMAVADAVRQDLHDQGFAFTVDDFHDVFQECLQELRDHRVTTSQQLLAHIFNDNSRSDYIVVFLRLITSSHLQKNSEFFQAFIEDGYSVKEFCAHEVEPMYKESDHIHVIAITTAIGVAVRINYLDRGGSIDKINVHDFPEGVEHPQIHLLYRPGHYDVLYPLSNGGNVSNHSNSRNDSRVTSSSPACTAAGEESSESCSQVTSNNQENGSSSPVPSGAPLSSGGESSDLHHHQPQQSQDVGAGSSNGSISASGAVHAHGHVTSSSSLISSPGSSPNNNSSTSNHLNLHYHHSVNQIGGEEGTGVSSSKNPRLDPGISSSESDSNEPASTTTSIASQ